MKIKRQIDKNKSNLVNKEDKFKEKLEEEKQKF